MTRKESRKFEGSTKVWGLPELCYEIWQNFNSGKCHESWVEDENNCSKNEKEGINNRAHTKGGKDGQSWRILTLILIGLFQILKKIILGFDAVMETNQKKSHWASGINNYFSFIPLGLGAENKFWISLDWSIKRMSNFLSFSKTPSVACNLQIKKKKKGCEWITSFTWHHTRGKTWLGYMASQP